MLALLKIRNLALVDSLTWNLNSGLISVTGETGAGKSVIVGALKLVLGERADKGMIRTGENQCTVEALFDLGADSTVAQILDDAGIEGADEGQLIIKRVIGVSSNKQFVNNCPATLSVLKRIGQYLVDLHGPHDHQSLLSNERQLAMLDAYADLKKEKVLYQKCFLAWKDKSAELLELVQSDQANEQEIDLLKFQVEEIDSANLIPDEESDIEKRYKRASNGSKLLDNASQISQILGNGLVEQLGEVQRLARDLERLDPQISDRLAGLDSAVVELQELDREIGDYVEELDMDPAEFSLLEERINTFETLKRKYGVTIKDVLDHADVARDRLARMENRGDLIDELKAEVKQLLGETEKVALKLTAKRKKCAPQLAKTIAHHLKDLGFKQAAFELTIHPHSSPESSGLESVDFQFGPNPGEPLKPLRNIASSGEISRVMLAVKSALAKQDATPLMVFDEIDANVGGEIARAVGEKMAMLGAEHQVISITHFPQVAAVANQHFVVEKVVEEGRTSSHLSEVEGQGRIDELVRMLGGGEGEEAQAMAESLLG